MLNVALTFDYELFFGENFGTSDEILFTPTAELLDLLDKHNTKATFFADVLSVYMHEKYGLNDYCEKFTAQIRDMVARGHDVGLHIHSNWLKSKYENGKWNFDIDSYRIHSYGFDNASQFSVDKIIAWGKEYLENSLKPVDENYRCISYRAGGYCIQPHQNLFKVLRDNGICIDSSVSLKQKSQGINSYDFTEIDKTGGWWLPINGELNDICEDHSEAIYELPIGAAKSSLLRRIFSPEKERAVPHEALRGTYIGTGSAMTPTVKPVGKITRILNYGKNYKRLTFDGVHYTVLVNAITKEIRKNKKIDSNISMIGHPKLIDSFWLQNFENLLIEITKLKNCKTLTISNIYDII